MKKRNRILLILIVLCMFVQNNLYAQTWTAWGGEDSLVNDSGEDNLEVLQIGDSNSPACVIDKTYNSLTTKSVYTISSRNPDICVGRSVKVHVHIQSSMDTGYMYLTDAWIDSNSNPVNETQIDGKTIGGLDFSLEHFNAEYGDSCGGGYNDADAYFYLTPTQEGEATIVLTMTTENYCANYMELIVITIKDIKEDPAKAEQEAYEETQRQLEEERLAREREEQHLQSVKDFYKWRNPSNLTTMADRKKYIASIVLANEDTSEDLWETEFRAKTTPEIRNEWLEQFYSVYPLNGSRSVPTDDKEEDYISTLEYYQFLRAQIDLDLAEAAADEEAAARARAETEEQERRRQEEVEAARRERDERIAALEAEAARLDALIRSLRNTTGRAPKDFDDVFDNVQNYIPEEEATDARTLQKTNIVFSIITSIGMIVAIVMLAVLGVKYMLSSVEEKAEYKKDMIPYLVGAILLFGITSFLKVLQQLGNTINGL